MPKPHVTSGSDDARFSAMHTASTFNTARKESHKVKLDGRFKGVLTDSRFRAAPGQVDRYGRKGKSKGNASKELEQFYQIEEPTTEAAEREISGKPKSKGSTKSSTEDRMEYINRLSRGEIAESSSSSTDSSDAESDSDSDSSSDGDDTQGEQATKKRSVLDIPQEEGEDEDVPTGDSSRRLALLHCDWDNIKAEDLLVVLQSFCPASGSVKSVCVYPSDFGIEHMAREEKFGPQGIWKAKEQGHEEGIFRSGSDSDGGDSADEDGNSEDIYDNVVGDLDADEALDSEAEAEPSAAKRKLSKGADFERKGNATGLILQEELVRRGKANPKTLLDNQDDDAPAAEQEDGLNTIALRDYELSKLKYYFAIAVLDSISTSEAIYEALDGVELEHSSMTFDLRFVPDDADFTERTIRDKCTSTATATYRPPDFMVNALQHTNVKCTWDEGDAERGRKLGGTLAQWKDLAESDMQQFLASGSDSDGEDPKPSKSGKVVSSKSKGKDMRKLLLGQSDDEAESDAGVGDDDFFTHPDDESEESGDEDKTDKVYNYVSNSAASKAEGTPKEGETPFEAIKRKMAEKKMARKQAKKELKSGVSSSEVKAAIHKKLGGAAKKGQAKSAAAASSAAVLELMFDAPEENDYDMRTVQKAEKLRKKEMEGKGKKKKKRGAATEDTVVTEETFKVDLHDSRFGKLIAGNSNFGIDPMSSEFKETKGMRDILEAQRKRRKTGSVPATETTNSSAGGVDLAALKSKFGNNAKNRNKK